MTEIISAENWSLLQLMEVIARYSVVSLIVPDVHLVDDLLLDRLAGLGQGPAQQDSLK